MSYADPSTPPTMTSVLPGTSGGSYGASMMPGNQQQQMQQQQMQSPFDTVSTLMRDPEPTSSTPVSQQQGIAGLQSRIPTNTPGQTSGVTPSILVTGATGTTGLEVLRILCSPEYHRKFKIVAGVHHDHGPISVLDEVDVVRHIDADKLGTLNFREIDILFIIPSNSENRVEQVANYVSAAARDGVKFILFLSIMPTVNTEASKQTLFSRQFAEMERLVSSSGIPCTFLRCSFFQQNLLAHAEELRMRGTLSLPIGSGRYAPVSVIDVARAAVALLADPSLHAMKAYDLTGPEVLSGDQIAEIASRALGCGVEFRSCSPQQFQQLYINQGVPPWLARGFSEILEQLARDSSSTSSAATPSGPASTFYKDLTGHQPITVASFFNEYRDLFLPSAQPISSIYSVQKSQEQQQLDTGDLEAVSSLLREMILDKQSAIDLKRRILRDEEARLSRMIGLVNEATDRRASYSQPRSAYDDRRYGSKPMRYSGRRGSGYGGYDSASSSDEDGQYRRRRQPIRRSDYETQQPSSYGYRPAPRYGSSSSAPMPSSSRRMDDPYYDTNYYDVGRARPGLVDRTTGYLEETAGRVARRPDWEYEGRRRQGYELPARSRSGPSYDYRREPLSGGSAPPPLPPRRGPAYMSDY
ncbi:hypothetical protein BC828DRAFT_375927 [Blastocladiella britannica]|nr:hypothetical protein BC828DRAFT_375927 [Blastocladiella britannica]